MSSTAPGKFQDHYLILGVDPKSDSDTIQAAYTKLSEKYNPGNPDTGDRDKFEAVNLAFEVLSDPTLRIGFDQLKGVDQAPGNPKFTGAGFFDALKQGALLRSAVLCVMYDRRRVKSFTPSLSMRHLEGMLRVGPEDLNFAIWYLKQRGFVENDDKSSLQITVEGMDHLEQNWPSPETVMPMIKEEALADPQPQPAKPSAAEIKRAEPVLSVLNRALQRNHPSKEAQPAKRK